MLNKHVVIVLIYMHIAIVIGGVCSCNTHNKTNAIATNQNITRGDWYMPYHDNSNTNRSNTLLANRLKIKWIHTSSSSITHCSRPVFYNRDIGLYTRDGQLYWFDGDGNVFRHHSRLQYEGSPEPSLTENGFAVVTSGYNFNYGKMLFIDCNNHIVNIVSYKEPLITSNVCIDNNDNLLMSVNGMIVKYSSGNGFHWQYCDSKFNTASDVLGIDNNNNIYVLRDRGTLECLDKDGMLKWSFNSIQDVDAASPIVCLEGIIIPGRERIELISYSGSLIWSVKTSSPIHHQSICLTKNNSIAFACENGDILYLDTKGIPKWKVSNRTDCASIIGTTMNDNIYVCYGNCFEIISSTDGSTVDKLAVHGNVLLREMSVSDEGSIVANDIEGHLYMLETRCIF
jgi:hypothetical protein